MGASQSLAPPPSREAHHAPRVGANRRASICAGHHQRITGHSRILLVSNGVSKKYFETLLETFAQEATGFARIVLLVLDNAGWRI
jgi:hypothetical protein